MSVIWLTELLRQDQVKDEAGDNFPKDVIST